MKDFLDLDGALWKILRSDGAFSLSLRMALMDGSGRLDGKRW